MQILDSYIMDWNNRIPSRKIWVHAQYSNLAPEINIVFKTQQQYADTLTFSSNNQFSSNNPKMPNSNDPVDVGDHEIDYRFTFSVAKEREGEFNEIFEKLKQKPLRNKVKKQNGMFGEIKIDIKPTITKTTHTVYKTEYVRLNYEFKKELYSSIIAYVYLLESTIEFFSMIWGYDEDGDEHNLLKFPVGSIVSKPNDKSIDYLVLDLEYYKNGGDPEIRYNIRLIEIRLLSLY